MVVSKGIGKLITLVARFAKRRTPGGLPSSQVPRSGPSPIALSPRLTGAGQGG